jgi:hypothetical protein
MEGWRNRWMKGQIDIGKDGWMQEHVDNWTYVWRY